MTAGSDVTREFVARLPKAELHVHLDGCLRPQTMLELADAYGIAMPATTPEALADAMIVRHARNLEEYLQKFVTTVSVMQTADAMERIAFEFIEDVAAENVRYVEVRYCPALHMPALSLEEAVEAPLAGLRRGEEATGTIARVILCGLRTFPPATSLAMARAAVLYRDQGVVAFDLAGAENGHPAAEHAEAFRHAKEGGVAITCHAGEGAGPESIRQALEICGAQRLGHGVRLLEDPALEQHVLEQGIPLEMCLTSNVHTHTVPDHGSHPIRRYLDAGIPVTLNTDSRLMDGVTLNDEYWHAHTALGFDRADLQRVAMNGFAHAFLPPEERDRILAHVQTAMRELA